jgi:hypothetical protein
MGQKNTKPMTATTTSPSREPWLFYLPLHIYDSPFLPPSGLTDYQAGWRFNLLIASLRNPVHQGYLIEPTDQLWRVAGSHRREYWDAHSREVMVAFEQRDIAGRKMWCLPALVELVEQTRHLWKRRKGGGSSKASAPEPDVGESVSPLHLPFAFDFESQRQNQLQNPSTSRARAPAPAEECARRMIELLALPGTRALAAIIAAAVTAESEYSGLSLQEAAQSIADHAMRARDQGAAVDRFYFEDTKWRNKRKSKSEIATDEFAERIERERNILRRAEGS